MELLPCLTSCPLLSKNNNNANIISYHKTSTSNIRPLLKTRQGRVRALTDVVTTVVDQPDQAQVTWEIVVGSLAGVTPFVVAGVEFSKRIVAQRKCEVCGGSGLVLRDKKYYFRCPRCGGFLPWQSWKRFFSG